MGTVWIAADTTLKRRVALKRLHAAIRKDLGAVARFVQEAQALASLQHPNIVQVYDVGEDGEGSFIVMEYLEGEDLAERLRRLGPLPAEEGLRLGRDLLEALRAAQAVGLVHRDIKPANVRADRVGTWKLIDWGIARPAGEARAELTAVGGPVGTPVFMAPEQYAGGQVDGRADLYALAKTLFVCFTGRPPHTIRLDAAEVPPGIRPILDRALQEDLGRRYASAADMLVEWERRIDRGPETETRHTPATSLTNHSPAAPAAANRVDFTPRHQRPSRLLVSVVVVMAIGAVAGALLLFGGRESIVRKGPDEIQTRTISPKAPRPPEGFAYSSVAMEKLLEEVCQEKGSDGLCEIENWRAWVRELRDSLVYSKVERERLAHDSEVRTPPNLAIEYPNKSDRVVFWGCRRHDCPSAEVWYLIDPGGRTMDIVWRDGDETRHIGDSAAKLKQARIEKWLMQINERCRNDVSKC